MKAGRYLGMAFQRSQIHWGVKRFEAVDMAWEGAEKKTASS